YETIKAFVEGKFEGGYKTFDLSVDGVGYSVANEPAIADIQDQLEEIKAKAAGAVGAHEASIFEAQLLMLADPELLGRTRKAIQTESLTAEEALERSGRELASVLEELPDDYLRARAPDLKDVVARVLALLRGRRGVHPLAALERPVVLVSDELLPTDTVVMDREKVVGLVTEAGTPTSHVAILARTMGIPAVVGARGVASSVRSGETLIADGTSGTVVAGAGPDEVQRWRSREHARRASEKPLRSQARLPAVTMDGHRVRLEANIGVPADLEVALAFGADGVGLFRTEFLFMGRDSLPGEDEQFEVYRDCLTAMAGRPLVVRTLDAGGDKPLPIPGLEAGPNPFLGVRGLRLCLERQDMFLVQLRALLRAAAAAPPGQTQLRVMFPMVADPGEVEAARRLLALAAEQLDRQGVARGPVAVGVMVEVPAAAVLADLLMEQVDFVSLGTNDLTQYVMAADRTNSRVAHLADALHPAVLRLVKAVVEAGRRACKPVAVCGDLAGDAEAVPILVGLGVEELSMAPPLLPRVKAAVRALSRPRAEELARRALGCRTAPEVRDIVAAEAGPAARD
ncbi:MAG TPA: phosphoenolpyruvate--protein phosphotransferase, partial [Clostridiales bacterium]|nr:phosphoenolpyruvate--protein phosphotransferase [Clostridiales bacterium]